MIKWGRKDAADAGLATYILQRLETSMEELKSDVRSSIQSMVPKGEHRLEMDGVKNSLNEIHQRLEMIEEKMITRESFERLESRIDGGPVPRWVWSFFAVVIALASLLYTTVRR